MAQLVVRNIEDDLKERLRRRAKQHGRSMEEEVREILRRAVNGSAQNQEGLGTRLAKRFKGIGFRKELPRLRGKMRAITFEK